MKKGFFGFGKDKYQEPQVASVPQGQSAEANSTLINEGKRQILVQIFDGGTPQDLALALGTLEIAKDIVKQTLSTWHFKDQRTKGIIKIPGTNGNG